MTSLGAYQGLTVVAGLASLIFLSPVQIFITFVVLGQGHFFLGYLYRLKAGKIDWKQLGFYLILLFGVFSFPLFLSYNTILAIVALLFSVHFFFDEARIMKGSNDISIPLILPPILLFFTSVLNTEIGVNLIPISIILSLAIFFSVFVIKGLKEIVTKDILYANCFTLFFIGTYIFNLNFSGEAIFGAIIIMHIFTWYMFYQKKTWSDKKRNSQYLIDVFLVNVLVIILFALFVNNFFVAPLSLLFAPVFYYCWAILHIITSSGALWKSTKTYFGH